MAQLPCFKGSWAIYPPFFFDIDGATQDSEPSTFTLEYVVYPNSIKISPKNLGTDSVILFTRLRFKDEGVTFPNKNKRKETKNVYKSG